LTRVSRLFNGKRIAFSATVTGITAYLYAKEKLRVGISLHPLCKEINVGKIKLFR
jgi:hypothetical protein